MISIIAGCGYISFPFFSVSEFRFPIFDFQSFYVFFHFISTSSPWLSSVSRSWCSYSSNHLCPAHSNLLSFIYSAIFFCPRSSSISLFTFCLISPCSIMVGTSIVRIIFLSNCFNFFFLRFFYYFLLYFYSSQDFDFLLKFLILPLMSFLSTFQASHFM